ncbi:unnamed protein product [marine sediment metagenome]|uniref:Uncharacterized protein n=1 Tax=marine sediment metagenome TaxID=412755 RepID=X1SLK9_9ZZZZ
MQRVDILLRDGHYSVALIFLVDKNGIQFLTFREDLNVSVRTYLVWNWDGNRCGVRYMCRCKRKSLITTR